MLFVKRNQRSRNAFLVETTTLLTILILNQFNINLEKMINSTHESDSDDSAPESVSFGTSKIESTEKSTKIKEQINSIRESQKKRRIERQEKYIEQKVNSTSGNVLFK